MKFIVCLAFLNSFFCFSQINNGVVTYGVVKNEVESLGDNQYLLEIENTVNELAPLLDLSVVFNKEEFFFKINEISTSSGKSSFNYVGLMQINKKYYSNLKDKIYRNYINNARVGEVVEVEPILYEWTITKETKIIDGYVCYKATTPLFVDGKKSEDSKFNVVAWFAPKIPVPYGPNGYGGLPGLILELQKYVSTIYVKSINLNVSPEPEMEKLEEYPQLTRKEVHEYMMSSMTPEQKKAVLDSKRINEK